MRIVLFFIFAFLVLCSNCFSADQLSMEIIYPETEKANLLNTTNLHTFYSVGALGVEKINDDYKILKINTDF